MDNLKDYRARIATALFVWVIVVSALSAGVFMALRLFMEDPLALIASGIVYVISLIFVGIGFGRYALEPTEYLARAILHVSSEDTGVPAPDKRMLRASTDFLSLVASYVYDMASKSALVHTHTETRARTSELEGICQNSPLPLISTDSDQTVTAINNATLQFLNKPSDELIGKPLFDVLKLSFSSDDTFENWLKYSQEKSVSSSRAWDRVKVTLGDESIKQIDLAAHFSKDSSSGADVVVALFDHTDKYTRDDSGASFVSMAVHELRTPLTVMRGYVEVFEDELLETLNSEQKEFLKNLSAQAQQLGSFVSNMQNLARIEENALELQLKQENWQEVLKTTLNDLDVRANVRHKELIRNIPDDLPSVAIDRFTMSEVITNLVENAIKYTHTNEAIEIKTYQIDPGWVETTIIDHGIGIPDSLVNHIFDKFYRSHRSSKAVGGTGLGLYICKKVIEAHGGIIWVKSKEGKGSTFGFTIPTFDSVASQIKTADNMIERRAHGWIKNHTLYRG